MSTLPSIIEAETLEYLPAKTLLRLIERQQKAAKNFKAFKLAIGTFPELFRALEDLDIEPEFSLDNEYINLSFAGDGPKLAAVWKLLRQHGFKNSCHPKKGDTTFYAFWGQEGHAQFFMNFTSSVPYHAHDDASHPDCENGVVSSIGDKYVFVRFRGETGQACKPDQLV